jgi:hypothetical protein
MKLAAAQNLKNKCFKSLQEISLESLILDADSEYYRIYHGKTKAGGGIPVSKWFATTYFGQPDVLPNMRLCRVRDGRNIYRLKIKTYSQQIYDNWVYDYVNCLPEDLFEI